MVNGSAEDSRLLQAYLLRDSLVLPSLVVIAELNRQRQYLLKQLVRFTHKSAQASMFDDANFTAAMMETKEFNSLLATPAIALECALTQEIFRCYKAGRPLSPAAADTVPADSEEPSAIAAHPAASTPSFPTSTEEKEIDLYEETPQELLRKHEIEARLKAAEDKKRKKQQENSKKRKFV